MITQYYENGFIEIGRKYKYVYAFEGSKAVLKSKTKLR
jgi:hypothetical protein